MAGLTIVFLHYPYIFLLRVFVTSDVCRGKIYRVHVPQSPLRVWNMPVIASSERQSNGNAIRNAKKN